MFIGNIMMEEFMKNVRIGVKLASGFLCMTLLTLILAAISYLGNEQLQSSLSEISEVRLPSVLGLEVMNEAKTSILRRERSLLTPELAADPKEVELQLSGWRSDWKRAQEGWDLYAPLPQTAEEERLWKAFIPRWEEWKKHSGDIVEYARQGNRQAALNLSIGEARQAFNEAEALLGKIIALNIDVANAAKEEGKATVSRVKAMLLAGTVACVVLAVFIGFVITRAITGPLRLGVDFATKVSAGDLNQKLDINQRDEIGILADAMSGMVVNLKAKIAEAEQKSREAAQESERARKAMAEATAAQNHAEEGQRTILNAAQRLEQVMERVTTASEELSAQIEQSSHGAETQAVRIAETATSMEEMNSTVLEVARNAGRAADSAEKARVKAQDGAAVVSQAVRSIQSVQKQITELKEHMAALSTQAEDIGSIMNVISDIADQTNLLALNAAIEAARAGDAGRGFAVVADEVRKLAEKTMTATKEVGETIGSIQDVSRTSVESVDKSVRTTEESTELASRSGAALQDIVTLVEEASDQVRTIATASEQQSSASDEINHAIEDINRISSETAQAMTQSTQAVLELAQQAQELKSLVDDMLNVKM